MNVLIISDIPDISRVRILECFSSEWKIHIASPGEEGRYLPEAEVIIPEHVLVDDAFLHACPKLKMIQTGAGYDNVDLNACRENGVIVCNAAGVNASSVAEHTMALILSWYKNIAILDAGMKYSALPASYSGAEMSDLTIGIIGLGAVGRNVAKLCRAFDMTVTSFSRHAENSVDLDTLLRNSDIVSLHVPLTAETRNLIGRNEFAKMKNSALLVNTSRGGVVNEDDLCNALESGMIAGACLDVFEQEPLPALSPLRQMTNVLLTPHTAGYPDGPKYHKKRYLFFADNIQRFADLLEPKNRIV